MFFAGTLEQGISTALQQSKQVVCFVTGKKKPPPSPAFAGTRDQVAKMGLADGEEESQQWEDDFLTDETVKTHLQTHAVTLRLQAGSTEAGYLEALFPVPRKPTLVIIEYVTFSDTCFE